MILLIFRGFFFLQKSETLMYWIIAWKLNLNKFQNHTHTKRQLNPDIYNFVWVLSYYTSK